jgi:hypothetical protein
LSLRFLSHQARRILLVVSLTLIVVMTVLVSIIHQSIYSDSFMLLVDQVLIWHYATVEQVNKKISNGKSDETHDWVRRMAGY